MQNHAMLNPRLLLTDSWCSDFLNRLRAPLALSNLDDQAGIEAAAMFAWTAALIG